MRGFLLFFFLNKNSFFNRKLQRLKTGIFSFNFIFITHFKSWAAPLLPSPERASTRQEQRSRE